MQGMDQAAKDKRLHAIVAFIVRDEWQEKRMGAFLHSGYKVNTEFDGSVYSVTYDLTK